MSGRLRLAVGALGGPASPSEPTVDTPKVGECRYLQPADVTPVSNETPVVDCQEPHTALTFYVGEYPPGSNGFDYPAQKCKDNLAEGLGVDAQTASTSAFTVVFFAPTTKQQAAGANWFRCDMVIGDSTRLTELPAGPGPYLGDGPVPDEFAQCLDAKGYVVTCAQQHTYRKVGEFEVNGVETFPGRKGFLELAAKPCRRMTQTENWWATWPAKSSWESGSRTMGCWTPDIG